MKKIVWVFLLMVCSTLMLQLFGRSTLSDKINLSREGGTTRAASVQSMRTAEGQAAEPVIEAFISQNVISLSVQNYRGGAWVEIIGPREVKQNYIEVYDMGFEVVDLSSLRAGEYTIRIRLGSEVYIGTFKKGTNGR